ncbi:hypothetical protein ACIBO9_04085 [Streptomyces prunicolor]|uniref:hypothetical protein n=1 Tax=Streptomyces prunicolor TaxID=67348 RepID=UPI0037D08CE3
MQDRDAGVGLPTRLREQYFSIRPVWADGGNAGRLVDFARSERRLTLDIVRRTDDTTGSVVLPRRWLAERTLSWLMRSRRLVRDDETLPAMHEAMVLWSMTMLMLMGSRPPDAAANAFIPRQPTPSSLRRRRRTRSAAPRCPPPRAASRLTRERTPSTRAGVAPHPTPARPGSPSPASHQPPPAQRGPT